MLFSYITKPLGTQQEQHTGHIQQHYMETLAEFQVILTTVNCTLLLGKHFLLSPVDSTQDPKNSCPEYKPKNTNPSFNNPASWLSTRVFLVCHGVHISLKGDDNLVGGDSLWTLHYCSPSQQVVAVCGTCSFAANHTHCIV